MGLPAELFFMATSLLQLPSGHTLRMNLPRALAGTEEGPVVIGLVQANPADIFGLHLRLHGRDMEVISIIAP